MQFDTTSLADVRLITLAPRADDRGRFTRTFCAKTFADNGLPTHYVQHNTSVTLHAGALRGMHFQRDDHAEDKVIRCVRGAVFDVLIDLRPASKTYTRWQGFHLTGENGAMLFAPKGFAHGFLTLEDNVEMAYLHSAAYAPQAEGGVRWNDPAFAIDWPFTPKQLNDRDRAWPDFIP